MESFDNNLDTIDPDINHFEPNINFQSHALSTFPNKQDFDPSSLNLIHHNARSLMASTRIDKYETLFKTLKHPFDILVFTETWLTPDKEDQCKFKGFNHLHLLRPVSEDIDFSCVYSLRLLYGLLTNFSALSFKLVHFHLPKQ